MSLKVTSFKTIGQKFRERKNAYVCVFSNARDFSSRVDTAFLYSYERGYKSKNYSV